MPMRQELSSWAEALSSASPPARREAIAHLARLGPEVPDALPLLVAALSDSDPGVREAAVNALAGWGRAVLPALPALLQVITSDANAFVRVRAVEALMRLHEAGAPLNASAVTSLAKAARDANPVAALQALELLRRLGPRAVAAVPTLRAMLQGGQLLRRRKAAETLRTLCSRCGDGR